MESIVLRDQIVRKISKDLSISQARSKTMVEALESIIASELKVKSRIKIAHFGTFVVKTRASRTVKTVREQKTKIILQQEVVRFIAADQFKNQLMGKAIDPTIKSTELSKAAEKKADPVSEKISITFAKPDRPTDTKDDAERISINVQTRDKQEQKNRILPKQTPGLTTTKTTKIISIQNSRPATQPINQVVSSKFKPAVSQVPLQPRPQIRKTTKPVEKIVFSPLSIYSRIGRAKVESEIESRLIKLAQSLKSQTGSSEKLYLAKTHEKIFASFIAQATKLKVKSLDFSLSKTRPSKADLTLLCAGRPRVCLGKIPTLVLYQFVSEIADIDTFQIPQHRFVTIKKPDNIKKVALEIHSFPTHQGASIHIGIL